MDVIPVIDLKAGEVVQARRGERASYRPIRTPLSATAQPLDVVRGLLTVFPFRSLYIADLDAIGRTGIHAEAIAEIAKAFPSLALWIDGGFRDAASVEVMLRVETAHVVIGSESQQDTSLLQALRGEGRILLSVDSLGARSLDPADLARQPELWPERVIVMTLDRVGAMAGPDLAAIEAIWRRSGGRRLYAAGGVRGSQDLEALQDMGVAGALVASALHGGGLTSGDLERILEKRRAPEGALPVQLT